VLLPLVELGAAAWVAPPAPPVDGPACHSDLSRLTPSDPAPTRRSLDDPPRTAHGPRAARSDRLVDRRARHPACV